jgi:hypothetical protein
MIERRMALLKRGGIDPMRLDKRPPRVVFPMNDDVPWARWERQAEAMRRAGYADYQDFLANWRKP